MAGRKWSRPPEKWEKVKGKWRRRLPVEAPEGISQEPQTPDLPAPLETAAPVTPRPVVTPTRIRGHVDDMDGELLQAYARQVGIIERDVIGLTPMRLRQNIKAMLFESATE